MRKRSVERRMREFGLADTQESRDAVVWGRRENARKRAAAVRRRDWVEARARGGKGRGLHEFYETGTYLLGK